MDQRQKYWLIGVATIVAGSIGVYWYNDLQVRRRQERRLRKRAKNINIGAVFGMDVGGTLAKLVYFERDAPSTMVGSMMNDADVVAPPICDSPSGSTLKTARTRQRQRRRRLCRARRKWASTMCCSSPTSPTCSRTSPFNEPAGRAQPRVISCRARRCRFTAVRHLFRCRRLWRHHQCHG